MYEFIYDIWLASSYSSSVIHWCLYAFLYELALCLNIDLHWCIHALLISVGPYLGIELFWHQFIISLLYSLLMNSFSISAVLPLMYPDLFYVYLLWSCLSIYVSCISFCPSCPSRTPSYFWFSVPAVPAKLLSGSSLFIYSDLIIGPSPTQLSYDLIMESYFLFLFYITGQSDPSFSSKLFSSSSWLVCCLQSTRLSFLKYNSIVFTRYCMTKTFLKYSSVVFYKMLLIKSMQPLV